MRWLAIPAKLALALALMALPAAAQQAATGASGGVVRLLDKISGETTDIPLAKGETKIVGRLTIRLGDCRYPTRNPNADSYGYLQIVDDSLREEVFAGWMFASSPALNAMDHPRYDVWLLRCNTQ